MVKAAAVLDVPKFLSIQSVPSSMSVLAANGVAKMLKRKGP